MQTQHGNSRSGAVRTPPPIVVDASASVGAGNGGMNGPSTNGIGGIGQAKPRLIRPASPGNGERQETEVSEDELRPSSVDADADADPDELENDGDGEEVDELRQTEKEVEDDLLEAVDAAEANSGSEKSPRE